MMRWGSLNLVEGFRCILYKYCSMITLTSKHIRKYYQHSTYASEMSPGYNSTHCLNLVYISWQTDKCNTYIPIILNKVQSANSEDKNACDLSTMWIWCQLNGSEHGSKTCIKQSHTIDSNNVVLTADVAYWMDQKSHLMYNERVHF